MTDLNLIFYYFILTYNLHLNNCEYIVITTICHDILSCARSKYEILLFYFILTYKELIHTSQYLYVYIVLNYNVNLYCRHKKLANFVHIYKICTIFTIFYANVYNINHFYVFTM